MFSAAVRAEQACRGSRDIHARRAAARGFAHALSAEVIAFISERNSAYIATATADGPDEARRLLGAHPAFPTSHIHHRREPTQVTFLP